MIGNSIKSLVCLLVIVAAGGLFSVYASPAGSETGKPLVCSEPGAKYYSIDLVSTKNVSGTGRAYGKARVSFKANPFGVAIAQNGAYQHQLNIQLNRIDSPPGGTFVAWATTPSLEKVKRLGALDENYQLSGVVNWNKYLVVVTLEPSLSEDKDWWEGPIAFRGMSRSGLMHTMAGHGPFEEEPCSNYGYY